MLAQALAVVEAARALKPSQIKSMPGAWRLGVEPSNTLAAVRDLGTALAEFDKVSGNRKDPTFLLIRAIQYADAHGISPEQMVDAIQGDDFDDAIREAMANSDLRPQPGEIGRPDAVTDGSPVLPPHPSPPRPGKEADINERYMPELQPSFATPPVAAPAVPVSARKAAPQRVMPVITGFSALGPNLRALQLEMGLDANGALADAGDYVQDAGIEMDAISDRLEYAVSKFGWTPKLRMLAAAWIHARNKLATDNHMNDQGMTIALGDAMTISRISADLAMIEVNPDLAFDHEYDDAYGLPYSR